jgi:hypothetical protein
VAASTAISRLSSKQQWRNCLFAVHRSLPMQGEDVSDVIYAKKEWLLDVIYV